VTASDAEVVGVVRQSYRDAFGELVRRYQRQLFGLVLMVRFLSELDLPGSTCSSSAVCCSSSLRSSSRIAAFSVFTASISLCWLCGVGFSTVLAGGIAGDCPEADAAKNGTDVNASTTEALMKARGTK
jgi:hypothetical protein